MNQLSFYRCVQFKGKSQGKPYARETLVKFSHKSAKEKLLLIDIYYVSKVGRLSLYVKSFVKNN